MGFAEVFLRLGCALVGWMLVYTYTVWMAALHVMGCGPDGDEMHGLLLGLLPVAVIMALLLRVTQPFPDIQRLLSWLGVPLALLLPFALWNTWNVFERATLDGLAICTNDTATSFHQIWAPAQFIGICLVAFFVARNWRNARIEKA
jgi:hypothetical protein